MEDSLRNSWKRITLSASRAHTMTRVAGVALIIMMLCIWFDLGALAATSGLFVLFWILLLCLDLWKGH